MVILPLSPLPITLLPLLPLPPLPLPLHILSLLSPLPLIYGIQNATPNRRLFRPFFRIQNATLRQNILFGLPYDEVRYNQVITIWPMSYTHIFTRNLTLTLPLKLYFTLALTFTLSPDLTSTLNPTLPSL